MEGCTEKVVFVDLSALQRELYKAIVEMPDFKMLAQSKYVNFTTAYYMLSCYYAKSILAHHV
jgi:hypothetical protein